MKKAESIAAVFTYLLWWPVVLPRRAVVFGLGGPLSSASAGRPSLSTFPRLPSVARPPSARVAPSAFGANACPPGSAPPASAGPLATASPFAFAEPPSVASIGGAIASMGGAGAAPSLLLAGFVRLPKATKKKKNEDAAAPPT